MMKNTPVRRTAKKPTPTAIAAAAATDSPIAAIGGQPQSTVAAAVA